MSIKLNNNINSATHQKVFDGPHPRDLLIKVKVLQELKKKFFITSPNQNLNLSGKGICATEAALGIEKKTLHTIFQEKPGNFKYEEENTLLKIHKLAEKLLKIETAFPHAFVCYHGNKSSLLPDIYGSLAHTLKIGEEEQETPFYRFQSSHFEKNTLTLLEKEEFIDDHSESIRAILLAASPTLISNIGTTLLENALIFYSRGESIATAGASERIYRLLDHWHLKDALESTLSKSIYKIEKDFPQHGFIHQLFFHRPEIIDQISYPSLPKGVPLRHQFDFGTTTEFLSALKSGSHEEILSYEYTYGVSLNDVQLRLLVDPTIFNDPTQVTIFCHHQFPLETKKYQARIRQEIIDPILEAGFHHLGPGGLFSLSPLAQTLGYEVPRLARLVDYVFVGADEPTMWIANGNNVAVEKAIKTKQLSATTTFGTHPETALELSALARQKEVFQLLLDQLKNSSLNLSELQTTRLFLSCFKNDWPEAAAYFLNDVNNTYIIIDVLILACQNNSELIRTIIDVKCKTGQLTLDRFDLSLCMKFCLKNQNFECFEWFLKEYNQIKKENSALMDTKIFSYVLRFVPPEKLTYLLSLFKNSNFDIDALETQLIKRGNFSETYFPDSYKTYYARLSELERSKLPFQKWWQLQFEKDE